MSGLDIPPEVKNRYLALVDLIGRTGSIDYRIEYTDPDNGVVMWIAIAQHRKHPASDLVPTAGAGRTPLTATHKLARDLIDGGECTHCHRVSVLEELDTPLEADLSSIISADADGVMVMCWYRYDPELKTYRRSCEGDA